MNQQAAVQKLLFRLDTVRCGLRDRRDFGEELVEELELAADALERVADQARDLACQLDLNAEQEARAAE